MTHPIDAAVGKNLQNIRALRSVSQSEPGSRVCVTFQISASKLVEMADVLDVAIADFFDGVSAKNKPAAAKLDLGAVSVETLKLVTAFDAITDKGARRHMLQLVKALSRGPDMNTASKSDSEIAACSRRRAAQPYFSHTVFILSTIVRRGAAGTARLFVQALNYTLCVQKLRSAGHASQSRKKHCHYVKISVSSQLRGVLSNGFPGARYASEISAKSGAELRLR